MSVVGGAQVLAECTIGRFGLTRALKVGVVEGVIDLNPGGLSSYLGIVVVAGF